ncbi:MAG: CheR family methyltransferase [Anaerolineales bacterium]
MREGTASTSALPTLGYGDYLRFSRLVHERYGLHFPEKRRPDLEQGVLRAFAASTCSTLEEYYRLLASHESEVYLQQLVNALTIGESHFFRDTGQFDALYREILPEIIERRRSLRTLRIWSAGCAAGEEPYSLAMTLRELLPDVETWSITLLATDVNTEALARAQKALYSEWAFREERAKAWRPRYFRREDQRYRLVPEVSRMVTFNILNLADDDYPSYRTNTMYLDLILCRNVTIYFTPQITQQIVDRFYDALVDSGWLAVGHSEHSLVTYQKFEARTYPNAICYQRTGRPTAVPQDCEWLASSSVKEASPPAPPPLPSTNPSVSAAAPAAAPPVEDRVAQARELLDYGHSERARSLLLEVVERGRPDAGIYTLLGAACANLGQWTEAERWCIRAIEVNKVALEPYYTLALVRQHQGELAQAVEAMKKVVFLDRTFVLGHYGLAGLYHDQGRLAPALKSLDNVRRLLKALPDQEIVPQSGGISVGSLRETVVRQLQQWGAESGQIDEDKV